MKNENKCTFATIVPTGEQPDGALHIACFGEDVHSQIEGSGKDIMLLAASLVNDVITFARKEGGRIAEDLCATLIVHALGNAINGRATQAELARLSGKEADEDGEV